MMDWLIDHSGMAGLLFFFAVFMSVVFWAYRPKAKEKIESYKFIPLMEDDK